MVRRLPHTQLRLVLLAGLSSHTLDVWLPSSTNLLCTYMFYKFTLKDIFILMQPIAILLTIAREPLTSQQLRTTSQLINNEFASLCTPCQPVKSFLLTLICQLARGSHPYILFLEEIFLCSSYKDCYTMPPINSCIIIISIILRLLVYPSQYRYTIASCVCYYVTAWSCCQVVLVGTHDPFSSTMQCLYQLIIVL